MLLLLYHRKKKRKKQRALERLEQVDNVVGRDDKGGDKEEEKEEEEEEEEDGFEHIQGLKDIVDAKLVKGRNGKSWVCPVSGREAGQGGGVWIMGWPCGCCGERKAARQIVDRGGKGERKNDKCAFCGEAVEEIVKLAMSDEEREKKAEGLKLGRERKKRERRLQRSRNELEVGRNRNTYEREGERGRRIDDSGNNRRSKVARATDQKDVASAILLNNSPRNQNFTGTI